MKKKIKFIPQHDQMDCGPACLVMISHYFGKKFSLAFFRENSYISKEGVSLLGIKDAAKSIGLESIAFTCTLQDFNQGMLPCILHWNQNHFVILYKITKSYFTGSIVYKVADPKHGLISIHEDKLKKSWLTDGTKGVALHIYPSTKFYEMEEIVTPDVGIQPVIVYLRSFGKQFFYLILLLFLGTLTTLVFPILTQKLIDEGVNKKDINLIVLILLAQLFFYIGNIIFEIFRNWISLSIGTKINIKIISDFLGKLLRLPINFFDSKMLGDFNQRIQDHERIEQFLTSQSLLTLFSSITFMVFFGVLWYYDFKIILVYIFMTVISVIWSTYWLKRLKTLDYFRFNQKSESQESIFEILNGISELKLNRFEEYKQCKWENIQHKLHQTNTRILRLNQIQYSGFEFINQVKNISVTFLASYFVVNAKMTLGELLSVSYIIGQMNSPISQLISFLKGLQNAKLSLSRLNEIQHLPEEEQIYLKPMSIKTECANKNFSKGITSLNLSFQYEGPTSPFVLRNINMFIPEGKMTAIVGASGSGKTTFMKLLLRFYNPTNGLITYNENDILDLSPKSIRENCGVVMQDGYIFSDTIERNVITGDKFVDKEKLLNAFRIANLNSFINTLPLGRYTKIGATGNGISGGQKQRILIARAVYKNPHYIFFDEATSALDAENEKIIHDNLQSFFNGRTVLIIAHRLSTVKNANQIIVLKEGEIVERGSHTELVANKGEYYNLVRNQLELGN